CGRGVLMAKSLTPSSWFPNLSPTRYCTLGRPPAFPSTGWARSSGSQYATAVPQCRACATTDRVRSPAAACCSSTGSRVAGVSKSAWGASACGSRLAPTGTRARSGRRSDAVPRRGAVALIRLDRKQVGDAGRLQNSQDAVGRAAEREVSAVGLETLLGLD